MTDDVGRRVPSTEYEYARENAIQFMLVSLESSSSIHMGEFQIQGAVLFSYPQD